MNFDLFFKRFFNDWQKFAWMGFGAFLVQLAGGAVATLLAFVLLGPGLFALTRSSYLGFPVGRAEALGFMGAALGFILLAVAIAVLIGGLANAGLVGSIVGYRRGEDVSLSTFWSYATRYFGKMILLGLCFAGMMLVSMLLLFIPILGWIALFIWIPTAAVTLALYPAYLIINDGYGVTAAVRAGFRVLTSLFGEALLGGAIMLAFGIVLGLIGWIPVLGVIVVGIFGEPLILFFFTERFETEVRPKLTL